MISIAVYKSLFLCRESERQIIANYASDDMKTPMHMTMGQEQVPVGVCAALGERAQVYSTYRSHGSYLARTGDVEGFFAELYGKVTVPAEGKGGSMHLANPEKGHMVSSAVVSRLITVAVGAAFAHRQNKSNKIAVTFFGDGAIDEGNFWESLNVAALMKVPVLMVCEDNGLAVHTHAGQRHGYKDICEIAAKFDIEVLQTDSTDVEDIYNLTKKAESLLDKNRPVLMYVKCYRYLEHVGVNEDFNAGYRPRDEKWLAKDSLKLQREKLLKSGVAEAEIKKAEDEIIERAKAAVKAAQEAPFPALSKTYEGVFA